MSDTITGIFRLIHIFSAILWVGGAFLWSMVVAPRILRDGPPAIRRPFAEAVIPALSRFFKITGILAIVSGVVLVGMIFGWSEYAGAFQIPVYGPSLAIGAVAAIGMAIVGFGIVSPTAHKLLATMQTINGPPTPAQQEQLGALGKKMGIMSIFIMLFGTIAIVGMVWAVNTVR